MRRVADARGHHARQRLAEGREAHVLHDRAEGEVLAAGVVGLEEVEPGEHPDVHHRGKGGLAGLDHGGDVPVGRLEVAAHRQPEEAVAREEVVRYVGGRHCLGHDAGGLALRPVAVLGKGKVEELAAEPDPQVVQAEGVDHPFDARVGDPVVVQERELALLQDRAARRVGFEEPRVPGEGGVGGPHPLIASADRDQEGRKDGEARVGIFEPAEHLADRGVQIGEIGACVRSRAKEKSRQERCGERDCRERTRRSHSHIEYSSAVQRLQRQCRPSAGSG